MHIFGKFLLRNNGKALRQSVQASGRVIIPRGFHEKDRCGTWGHGLVGNGDDVLTVGQDDPRAFSNKIL